MLKKDYDNAIRNQYEEMGVEQFYKKNGADYSNPHFSFIRSLLYQNKERIDYNSSLDLCCGAGEVSQVLMEMGYNDISACDPFTQKAYFENVAKKCLDHNFDYIIKNGFPSRFSSVICSFAMHLCPKEKLYPLVSRLFESTKQIIIITPHKRPELEKLTGVILDFEDSVLTKRGKKVRLKSYSHTYIKN